MGDADGLTVAMVHATPAAIAPAVAAFGERFPEAGLWHLLDDRLVSDAERAGGLVAPLRRRMLSLIGHAVAGGADGVLLTCSMYGPVAALAGQLWDRPVAGSDEAMFARVAAERPTRVAVLGSLEPAVADSSGRLRRVLAARGAVGAGEDRPGTAVGGRPAAGPGTEVVGVCCPGAAAAARDGDGPALLAALRAAAEPLAGTVEVFLLGQYSLAGAQAGLQAALGVPVWSPPHAAADLLRGRLRPAGP
jgi:Asp/Glu/hydantoin racemase